MFFLPGGYKRSTASSRFCGDRFTDGLGPPQRGVLILELSTKLRMIALAGRVGELKNQQWKDKLEGISPKVRLADARRGRAGSGWKYWI